jgi:hypothetical protein
VQPMHHHVSGARFRPARRLGYDGGGDLNMCRRGRHKKDYDASILKCAQF